MFEGKQPVKGVSLQLFLKFEFLLINQNILIHIVYFPLQMRQNQRRDSLEQGKKQKLFEDGGKGMEIIHQDDQYDKVSQNPEFKPDLSNQLHRMYEVPANYHKAHIHKKAYKFGINTISAKVDTKSIRCECCGYYVATEQLGLCHPVEILDKQQLSKQQQNKILIQLPLGVSLYFSFIKMIITYFILRFLVFDCYNLYITMYGNYCSDVQKTGTTDLCTITASGYNLKGNHHFKEAHVLDNLNFIFTIISIVYFIFFKRFMEDQKNYSRAENVNEDDFSILIENIPAIVYNKYDEVSDASCDHELELQRSLEREIRFWLQSFDQNPATMRHLEKELEKLKRDYKSETQKGLSTLVKQIVKSITICYDLTEMENIDKLRDNLIELVENVDEEDNPEYSKVLREEDDGPYSKQMKQSTMIRYLPNQIKMTNQKYIQVCQNFLQSGSSEKEATEFKLSHFTGKAIVTFQYQHFRDYFLREYEQDPNFLQINGTSVIIRRANKPSDIYWFNMKVKDEERTTYTRYAWGVLIMLLIISFASFVGLELLQSHETVRAIDNKNIWQLVKRYAVTASTGLLATGLNLVLGYTIELLSTMERHKTKSDKLSSLIFKNIVTQSINTSVMYLILYFIQPINPLGQYGLVNKVISVVIVSGSVSIILNILRPGQLWTRYKHKQKEAEAKQKKAIKTVQIKLNRQYEHPKFAIAENYAFYIVIAFTVSFYGFLVPMATPIAIGVFFVSYWVDKYNLFYRSSPSDFSYLLGKQIFSIFQVSLFLFTFGYFGWDLVIRYDHGVKVKIINIASLLISAQYAGFYLVVPQVIKNKIVENKELLDPKPYNQYQKENAFTTTYYYENPATMFLKDKKAPAANIDIEEKPKGTEVTANMYQSPPTTSPASYNQSLPPHYPPPRPV